MNGRIFLFFFPFGTRCVPGISVCGVTRKNKLLQRVNWMGQFFSSHLPPRTAPPPSPSLPLKAVKKKKRKQ